MTDSQDDCLIVSVHSTNAIPPANEVELRVNSSSVLWADLRRDLKMELSRRADRVVFVEGDGNLQVADVMRVIDIARGAWPGIPVVLLTPALNKKLGSACADVSRDHFSAPPRK
jgi:biopolymer transport protein ExbD